MWGWGRGDGGELPVPDISGNAFSKESKSQNNGKDCELAGVHKIL